MKYWMCAALFVAACASGEPAPQSAASAASPNYSDARSNATDAQVRDARRAYRGACEQHQSNGYCECMTGGMAQALSPAELAVATAALSGQSVAPSPAVRDRVSSVRAEIDRGCAQFRRG